RRPGPDPPAQVRCPYRDSIALFVVSALGAGWIEAIGDVVLTLRRVSGARPVDGMQYALVATCFYSAMAVVTGVCEGLLFGAVLKTLPEGFVTRLWRRIGRNLRSIARWSGGCWRECWPC